MDVPLCTCGGQVTTCGLLGTELGMPGLAACALHTGPSCQPLFIISKPHLFTLCICCPVPEFKFCKYTFILTTQY